MQCVVEFLRDLVTVLRRDDVLPLRRAGVDVEGRAVLDEIALCRCRAGADGPATNAFTRSCGAWATKASVSSKPE